FDKRRTPDLYSEVIIAKLRARVQKEIPEASVNIFGAPAVSGLGRAGGFRVMIEDRGDVGPIVLQGQTANMIEKLQQQPLFAGLFTSFTTNSPQLYLDVDRTACLTHGVELRDLFGVLQSTMGSRYVNDFNRFGRTWQVNVQADQRSRDELADIKKLKVRNRSGTMVPLGALLTIQTISGPPVITRHNMYTAATVNGSLKPGFSSGDMYTVFEEIAERELLPGQIRYEWAELAFIEQQAGRTEIRIPGITTIRGETSVVVFTLSVMFVFLALAALYESWVLPLSVLLVVPVCVVGSLAAVGVAGQDVNIFTQVGFVVLIGLASKNAILIVEYAKQARKNGVARREAIRQACQLRFRPILMTSVAFLLGVIPLLLARGAGAEMRQALGTAVFGGMIGVTLFGIFLTPIFFLLMDGLAELLARLRLPRRLKTHPSGGAA
ncbi:MAG: efflux RND transporter permease subunit, partial [Gemmataceae bacterium]